MQSVFRYTFLAGCFPLGSVGVAGAQEPSSQSSASQEFVATEDTSVKTPHGDPFKVPKDWRLQRRPDFVLLNAPEGDALLAMVHPGAAANATDAIKRAWAQVRPGADYAIRFDTPIGPQNGWSGRREVYLRDFAEREAESRGHCSAVSRRLECRLFDGSNATAEKRGSQLGVVLLSLIPRGYVRETFAGRAAHPLDAERIAILKKFVTDGMGQARCPGRRSRLHRWREGGIRRRPGGSDDWVRTNPSTKTRSLSPPRTRKLCPRFLWPMKLMRGACAGTSGRRTSIHHSSSAMRRPLGRCS